jgi:hypothetical protein
MPKTSSENTIDLKCSQLGTTDYFSFDSATTFNDIVNQIKEKYGTEVLGYIQDNFQNIRKGLTLDEVTIKLHYINRQGLRETIGLFTRVEELRKKISKLFWEIEPIGGLTHFQLEE